MFSSSNKPRSAITVLIDRLTLEQYDVDDLSDLPSLIEAIRLQSTGPTEAARALRKKLKYGSVHAQLRSLTILDDLIQNTGPRFQRSFADEPLLERLRFAACDSFSDHEVKQKCEALFRQWAISYKDTPGMERISSLYKQLPMRKKLPTKENSKVLRETEVDDDDDDAGTHLSARPGTRPFSTGSIGESFNAERTAPSSFSSQKSSSIFGAKDKKSKKMARATAFILEREVPQMKEVMASAAVESTNLLNAIKRTNREKERVSENRATRESFEMCKQLRRQTFRYCSLVEDEKYLGPLLFANDSLSDALVLYEQLDRSFDYDSDSEDYEGHASPSASDRRRSITSAKQQLAGLHISSAAVAPSRESPTSPRMPPRPPVPGGMLPVPAGGLKGKWKAPQKVIKEPEEEPEEDEEDPFADRNEISEAKVDKQGRTWRDV